MVLASVGLSYTAILPHSMPSYSHSGFCLTGTANEDFSEFVVDRLEMCIVSVSRLVHHLRSTDPLNKVASTVGAQYSTDLDELLDCLRIMLHQWQHHYQTRNESSFSVSVARITQRGRPRFDISQNQLAIYLGPNCFNFGCVLHDSVSKETRV